MAAEIVFLIENSGGLDTDMALTNGYMTYIVSLTTCYCQTIGMNYKQVTFLEHIFYGIALILLKCVLRHQSSLCYNLRFYKCQ